MNANIVFSIVQALPMEEQRSLLKMMRVSVSKGGGHPTKNEKLLTRAEADAFILRTVFKSN